MSAQLRKVRQRPVVHVIAGVILDAAGRVLLAQRPKGRHLSGGWEFPGGKIERGEARFDGLGRELMEEIGITLRAAHPLIRLRHAYPERDVDLDVWMVTDYVGEPHGAEGQFVSWCRRADLAGASLVPADRPVVTALMLPEVINAAEGTHYRVAGLDGSRPRVCAIEHSSGNGSDPRLCGTFCIGSSEAAAAVAFGADFLLLGKTLDLPEIAALTATLNVPVFVRHIALFDAWDQGATGVHTLGW